MHALLASFVTNASSWPAAQLACSSKASYFLHEDCQPDGACFSSAPAPACHSLFQLGLKIQDNIYPRYIFHSIPTKFHTPSMSGEWVLQSRRDGGVAYPWT